MSQPLMRCLKALDPFFSGLSAFQVRVVEETFGSEETTTEVEEVEEQNDIHISSSEDEDGGTAFPDTQVNLMQPIGNIRQNSDEPTADEEIIVYSQAVRTKKIVTVKNKRKGKG